MSLNRFVTLLFLNDLYLSFWTNYFCMHSIPLVFFSLVGQGLCICIIFLNRSDFYA